MTGHDPQATTEASPDDAVAGAEPRPPELTDKLDEIVNTPADSTPPDTRPVSTSPNNEAEARPGAVAPQEFQKEPGEAMGGGQSGG